ncbi:alpha/beta fold hydrolase [Phenylobacterium deserti]|nr:alpha/beta hydrolase [Phenylobacterium deserti]
MDQPAIAPRTRTIALPSRGGEIAALEFGPGDRPVDVVFSHANGFNAATYRSILAPLSSELRILAYDLRGQGRTRLPAEAGAHPGWTVFRDDLLAVLEAETSGPVVLAGHSMGATASLLAAASQPDRVRELLLFEPVIFPGIHQAQPGAGGGSMLSDGALRRRRWFASRQEALQSYRGRGAFRTWSEEQLADYVEAGFVDQPDGGVGLACAPEWEAASYRMHRYDPVAAFAATGCPVLVLRGEHHSTVQITGDDLPTTGRIELRTVPGASHFLPMEHPQLLRRELRRAAGD